MRGASRRACEERALVLRAVGIASRVERPLPPGEGWLLVVDGADARRAARELAAWEAENEGWPPAPAPLPPFPASATPAAGLYALALLLVGALANAEVSGRDWRAAGGGHAGRLLDGEWWRAVTALTLHLDLAHLVGNLTFGMLFGLLVSQLVGTGVAWASALASGTLGNVLNSAMQGPDHRAVGASTAVFGLLGVLVAYEWRRRGALRLSAARRWTPPVLGLVLLGWLGVGGERTDVGAHVSGMLAGAVLGALCGALLASRGRIRPPGPAWQAAAGLGTVLVLAAAWAAALAAA